MTANGFLEQKPASPLSFGAVLALHGAAIAAVLLIKGPIFERSPDVDTKTYNVRPVAPPPETVPPPEPDRPLPQTPSISRLDTPQPLVRPPVPDFAMRGETVRTPPGPLIGNDPAPPSGGTQQLVVVPPRPPIRTPVRVEAQFDPRFSSALQPPYPASEQRAQREGTVQVRVTIGPDGRVISAQRLSATSEAFWRVTERQALSRWRFRPATVDGEPVQSSKVLSVRFRLDGQ